MKPALLLCLGRLNWSVFPISAAAEAEQARQGPLNPTAFPQAAGDIARAVAELGGGPVHLALPSGWVFAATVRKDDLPRRKMRMALLYRLEEQLPFDAEDLAVQFIQSSQTALGLAVRRRPLQDLAAALRDAGVQVQSIRALPLMALRSLGEPLGQSAYAVIASGDTAETFALHQGQPIRWASCHRLDDARAWIAADLLTHHQSDERDLAVAVAGEAAQTAIAMLAEEPALAPRVADESPACGLAARAARGGGAGWADFSRFAQSGGSQPLSRPTIAAAALMLLLLLAAAGAMGLRGRQLARQADGLQALQQQQFKALYPSARRVPENVRPRLRSELAALGNSGQEGLAETPPNALVEFSRILSALPANVPVRLTRMSADGASFRLSGEVRAHSDAEAIAQSLTAAGLFAEPPKTEALSSGGASFVINGRVDEPSQLANGRR